MRFVVKVGTRLVTKADNRLNLNFIKSLVAQIASLISEGHEVVLVTSGAVAAGRTEIVFEKEKENIPYRQVLAAAGQNILMRTYQDFFRRFGITVAQALLTNYDFTNKENFLNTRRVLEQLLGKKIVPIVNENDVTTIAELKFGDNDMLSAKTAVMISADLLILLTTVDGLFTDNPAKNKNAEFISFVPEIGSSIFGYAKKEASQGSLGGMHSKVKAAQYAASSGISVCIANGSKTNIARGVVSCYKKFIEDPSHASSFPGTFFRPYKTKEQSFKKWLKPKIIKGAAIIVDDGCKNALLKKGKSLLASGIKDVLGSFSRGSVVAIQDLNGNEIGYGQVNYESGELFKIKGRKSSEFEKNLGYMYEDEIVHRDRMVVR